MKIPRIGELLVEAGVITEGELEFALKEQQREGRKLHEIIIDLGYATEETIMRLFSYRLGIEYIDPTVVKKIPEDIKKKIPDFVARKWCIFPLCIDKEDHTEVLKIVMNDPLDVKLLEELHILTGYKIKPVIASKTKIREAITRLYK